VVLKFKHISNYYKDMTISCSGSSCSSKLS